MAQVAALLQRTDEHVRANPLPPGSDPAGRDAAAARVYLCAQVTTHAAVVAARAAHQGQRTIRSLEVLEARLAYAGTHLALRHVRGDSLTQTPRATESASP